MKNYGAHQLFKVWLVNRVISSVLNEHKSTFNISHLLLLTMELVNVMVRPLYFYCRETSNGIYGAMSIVWVLFDQLPLGFLPPQSMEVPGDLFTLLAALKEENISAVLCLSENVTVTLNFPHASLSTVLIGTMFCQLNSSSKINVL